MKFRKKPIVVEAIRFLGPFSIDEMDIAWGKSFFDNNLYSSKFNCLRCDTLEGHTIANVGDWIIKGIKGEFYPCKPDIFEATYEKVED